MPNYQSEKSITLVVPALTFFELDNLRKEKNITLLQLYSDALEDYLKHCKPERKKVLGTPSAGKRIRVFLDDKLHFKASEISAESGFALTHVMYTALEYYLDSVIRKIAS